MEKTIIATSGFVIVDRKGGDDVIVEGDTFKVLGFIDSVTLLSISSVDSALYNEGHIIHITLNQLSSNFKRI